MQKLLEKFSPKQKEALKMFLEGACIPKRESYLIHLSLYSKLYDWSRHTLYESYADDQPWEIFAVCSLVDVDWIAKGENVAIPC